MGDDRWVLMRAVPYQIGPKQYSGVVATFVDITGRRATEQALRRNEAWLRESSALAR